MPSHDDYLGHVRQCLVSDLVQLTRYICAVLYSVCVGLDLCLASPALHHTAQPPCYISHREEDDHPYDLPIIHIQSLLVNVPSHLDHFKHPCIPPKYAFASGPLQSRRTSQILGQI